MTRVVVIGAGFAGIEVARKLGAANIVVTLIDRQNHHLFQPLLYQVATAALSPADIAEPIRKMLRGHPSVEVVLGEVDAIDTAAQTVTLSHGENIAYDILVLTTGATHGYFGHDEWERFAPGLKTIEDARRIRSHLLLAFEQAEMSRDPAEQKRLMTIAVIGGGPTGVELAGSIAELARYTLAKDFHRIHAETATVLLLEAGPRLLTAFPEDLATYAVRQLTKLGVTVRTSSPVEQITDRSITVAGETIGVGFAIWAAGVMASKLGQFLGVDLDRAGRVRVNADLSVPSLENVYVLGDLALAMDEHGKPLPGLAQVAKQEGEYLGRALARKIQSGETPKPFVFHNRGNTAIIGRHAAVFDFGRARMKGWFAWCLWALIHVYLLVGFQHRFMVAIQWLWRYVTYERGSRLIAEDASKRP
jgi:NADH dehydrogenase